MKKPNKFEVILNIWISLVINIVLSIVLPYFGLGFVTWLIFIKGFAIAFPVSTLVVFVIPIVRLGDRFAGLFKVKPQSFPAKMLSTIIVALILCTCLSLLMTAVNAGVGPWFVAAWLSAYPFAMLSVYVSALAGILTGVPLTKAILHIPKDAA